MSRFATNPKWLIYLPPTMSPSETSRAEGLLEHPAEAFAYYRSNGVPSVVVEQKHMGSRAILIACRTHDVARERFGILEDEDGICFTRTGRRFFEDMSLERGLLRCVRERLDRSGFWERLNTDWVCLDCELMPWSAKALELVRQQYAAVGAAARVGLSETIHALDAAASRGIDVTSLLERQQARLDMADRFARAYRNYCWPVESLRDIRIAPFALGIEGLERFVKREPLRRVHECVFGVLALESEPVDPRL